jgi:hypothetical protein
VLNRQLRDYVPPGANEMPLEVGHRNIDEIHAAIGSRIKSPLTS